MKILNTTLIKQFNLKIEFIVIFLALSTLIQTTNLLAQERETKRDGKRDINIDELKEKFSRSESVNGYIINGQDIIDIIKDTNHAILIDDSIIEGSLDFTKLPKESLEKEKLPKDWSEEKKEKYIRKRPWLQKIRIVTNKIKIVNSKIGSEEKKSINSEGSIFYEPISFGDATFSGDAFFSGATFRGDADFSGATFSGGAYFGEAAFSGDLYFRGTTFRGDADFSGATFSREAYFGEATFSGEASFGEATFSGGAYFSGATFSGGAYFGEATFRGEADFSGATFSGDAYFSGATFSKSAHFKEAKFLESLDFRSTNIKYFADFRNTIIRKLNFNCSESPTIIEGRIDFREAIISGAHFQDLIFEKDVDLSDVQFNNLSAAKKTKKNLAVVFRFITFESDAYFIRTIFAADTAFERINFEKDADFTETVFSGEKNAGKHNLFLSYLNFQSLLINWSQLPNLQFWVSKRKDIMSFSDKEKDEKKSKAKEEVEAKARKSINPSFQVIKRLEANFRSRNQLGDANEAYYHMKNIELRENRSKKDFMEWFPAQVHWIVWRITCGYGTRIYQILAWCVIFNLLFAISYFIKGQLKPAANKDDSFKLRLFDFPRLYLGGYTAEKKNYSMSEFVCAFKFSSVILFKIGYRDTTISGNIMGVDYKYIVWMEWLLGFYLLASLVVTLSNTVPLIHRLITGVF